MKVYDINNNEYNLQEIEDTGWVTITSGVEARKINNVVTINFNKGISANGGTWSTVCTLPTNLRPSREIYGVLSINTPTPESQENILINFQTGAIMAICSQTSTYIGSITYPV